MWAQPIVGVWCDATTSGDLFTDDECPFRPRWREILHDSGVATRCFRDCAQLSNRDGVLDPLDGLLVISCRDLSPGRSEEDSPLSETPSVELVRHAQQSRIPYLGVGMGIQLLNVAFGGTLQRISNDPHWGTPHVQPHHPRHRLVISPDSRLAQALARENLMVKSSHQVAINQVAGGFRITGWSPEGAVEAIESKSDDWPAVAVQFEPDTDAGCSMDVRLIEEFATQVRQARDRLVRKPR